MDVAIIKSNTYIKSNIYINQNSENYNDLKKQPFASMYCDIIYAYVIAVPFFIFFNSLLWFNMINHICYFVINCIMLFYFTNKNLVD